MKRFALMCLALLALLFVPQFTDTLPIFGEEVTVAFPAVDLIQIKAPVRMGPNVEGVPARSAASG